LIAKQPGAVRACFSDARYWDIGTVMDYWKTSHEFSAAPEGSSRSILWDNVRLGAGATLDECIVTDGVDVPAGATYRRRILLKAGSGLTAVPFEL
jgi:hypothetical protein